MRSFTAACAALILVAGCATLTEDECRQGNWQEIGQRDGANGRTADHVSRHFKACEKTGIKPDISLWEKGRQQGLPMYCTPARAYREGRDGHDLSPVCPAADLRALAAANEKGQQYHRIGEEISDLRSEINEVETALIKEQDESRRASHVLRLSTLQARISMLEARRMLYATL